MLSFCGIDKCSVDANGRIKLSPRVIDDFAAHGGDVVLHCLPEGTIAVYPEAVYLECGNRRPTRRNARQTRVYSAGPCAVSERGHSPKRFRRREGSPFPPCSRNTRESRTERTRWSSGLRSAWKYGVWSAGKRNSAESWNTP